jgi:ABC-type branched-subunit amino acid transport system substrate-binding protein
MAIFDEDPKIGTKFPDGRAGVEAGETFINQSGGLGPDHHPVEAEICVTQATPDGAEACARKAAADPSYVAVIGSYSGTQPIYYPILEEAALPVMNGLAVASTDGVSKYSFTAAVLPPETPGFWDAVRNVIHVEKLAFAIADTVGADQAAEAWEAGAAKAGIETERVVTPVAKPDLSVEAQQLIEYGGAVFTGQDSTTGQRTMQTILAAGKEDQTYVQGTLILNQDAIKTLGAAVGDSWLISSFAPNSVDAPGVHNYVNVMEEIGKLGIATDVTKATFVEFMILQQAAENLDDVSRSSLLASLRKLKFDGEGLTPTIDFSKPGPLPGVPAYRNPTLYINQVKGEEVELVKEGTTTG